MGTAWIYCRVLEGETIIGAVLGLALGLALDAWRKAAALEAQLTALQKQVKQLGQQTPSKQVVCATAAVEAAELQARALQPAHTQTSAEPADTVPANSRGASVQAAAEDPPFASVASPVAADPWLSPSQQAGTPALSWLQPLLRLGFIGCCGAGLVGLGWWKRRRLGDNAALLQGAGFAVVYLTLFAACKYYPMIGTSTAFALMLLTVLAGAALLAVVLVTLFLVDLADAGSLRRIVSFITVGGLTVLIGIKAPMLKAVKHG